MSGEKKAALLQAYAAIEALEERLAHAGTRESEPIAIGRRLGGGAFVSLRRDGVDGMQELSAGRWDRAAWFDADAEAGGKLYVDRGGYLEKVEKLAAEGLRLLRDGVYETRALPDADADAEAKLYVDRGGDVGKVEKLAAEGLSLLRDGGDGTRELRAGRCGVGAWFDADADAEGKLHGNRGSYLGKVEKLAAEGLPLLRDGGDGTRELRAGRCGGGAWFDADAEAEAKLYWNCGSDLANVEKLAAEGLR